MFQKFTKKNRIQRKPLNPTNDAIGSKNIIINNNINAMIRLKIDWSQDLFFNLLRPYVHSTITTTISKTTAIELRIISFIFLFVFVYLCIVSIKRRVSIEKILIIYQEMRDGYYNFISVVNSIHSNKSLQCSHSSVISIRKLMNIFFGLNFLTKS